MNKSFCQSCGMPINDETKHAKTETYCKYCADEKGKLNPREVVQTGVSQWLQMFAAKKEGVDFMKRADYYLKAMPAWAE